MIDNPTLIAISYIAQAIGFVLVFLAWIKACIELRRGERFFSTRLLLFVITSLSLIAYIIPTLISICYFQPGCFQPAYRNYLRLVNGTILSLFGLFLFLLYYTKDGDRHPLDKGKSKVYKRS